MKNKAHPQLQVQIPVLASYLVIKCSPKVPAGTLQFAVLNHIDPHNDCQELLRICIMPCDILSKGFS